MAQQAEQMSINTNALGSIPNNSTSSSRVWKFLSDIAENTHGESTAIDRKIAQLKAQSRKLKENAKKTKQRIRE
jgi:hypothetical protein